MRIAMIEPFGLAPKAPMQARAMPLARALAQQGHAVKVIMPPWHTPEEKPRVWEDGGVTVEYVSLVPRVPGLGHLAITWRLVRSAIAWRPDVVHCFKPKAYAGLVAWVFWQLRDKWRAAPRLVVDEDDWEGPGGWNDLEPYATPLQAFFAWQERWGLRHCDAVTVASRTLQSLVWSLGVTPEKVHYVPNGVSPRLRGDGGQVRDALGLGDAPVLLLYTRFFEYDLARFVDVLARVRAQVPEVRLLVVGKGLYAWDDANFNALVTENGLDDAVVRAGWVPLDELGDYIAAGDVAVYPFDDTLITRTKCSAKLLELLSAGVPVVADAVGQNVESIIHRETGLLVSDGDRDEMADAIVSLLRDRELALELGTAAAERVAERFGWQTLTREVVRAYEWD